VNKVEAGELATEILAVTGRRGVAFDREDSIRLRGKAKELGGAAVAELTFTLVEALRDAQQQIQHKDEMIAVLMAAAGNAPPRGAVYHSPPGDAEAGTMSNRNLRPGDGLHILHLSDFHLGTSAEATLYLSQLETDLQNNLKCDRIDLLVVSGDLADRATEDEFQAAVSLINGIVAKFGLEPRKVVLTPGNHDLNWDDSAQAFSYIAKHRKPATPTENYEDLGENGALLRDGGKYNARFGKFSSVAYQKIVGSPYPLDPADQGIVCEFPEYKVLLVTLNSCWQIDHLHPKRRSINQSALANVVALTGDTKYSGWVKGLVFHHALTGTEAMDDSFLQIFAVQGFRIAMHGDIHEAVEGIYKYDDRRNIHIIGAGTFGARPKQQVTGIPLQYNFMVLDTQDRLLTIHSRKKEKPNGAWAADARWTDKENPAAWRTLTLGN
jgi:hypothetical protein